MRTLIASSLLALLCLVPSAGTQAQPNPCVFVNMHPNQATLPPASLGVPYAQLVWVTPNNPCIPHMWTVTGSLPAGLSLTPTSQTSAVIAGIPTATGSSTFTITAQCTYICGTVCFVSKTYTIVVS